jgi:hypothetical protein
LFFPTLLAEKAAHAYRQQAQQRAIGVGNQGLLEQTIP